MAIPMLNESRVPPEQKRTQRRGKPPLQGTQPNWSFSSNFPGKYQLPLIGCNPCLEYSSSSPATIFNQPMEERLHGKRNLLTAKIRWKQFRTVKVFCGNRSYQFVFQGKLHLVKIVTIYNLQWNDVEIELKLGLKLEIKNRLQNCRLRCCEKVSSVVCIF